MGLTKTESYTDQQIAIAAIAKALGHPARVAILQMLVETEKCICGEFVDELPLSQATISQHLNELKKAGLIKGNINRSSMCYCLDNERWEEVFASIDSLLQPIRKMTKCC